MKNKRPDAAILANIGRKCSIVTRQKIGLANIGKGGKCRKNYKHSKETIEKIRKANTGKIRTILTRKKQQLAKLKNPTRYWLGKKRSKITIEKIRIAKIGKSSPLRGHHLSESHRTKISIAKTGKTCTEIARKHYSDASKKRWENPELRNRLTLLAKKRWENPEYAKKILCVDSPNMQEKRLQKILDDDFPGQWSFVGNGQLRVGRKYPDFKSTSKNKLIELYGDYYHKGQNPQDRIDYFKNFGYDTLVICASELKNTDNILEKIKYFQLS